MADVPQDQLPEQLGTLEIFYYLQLFQNVKVFINAVQNLPGL